MFVEDVTYIADEVGKKLVGGEITGAIRTEDDDYPSWGIRVKTKKGEVFNCWIDCDPEGNGPGFMSLEQVE